jgi:NAD(P)-dependent dehydrogenase (short-subunit alcohol dehydrogenase family)
MAAEPRWTDAEVPDLTGRTAVVTGANTGLGFGTARILAAHGAHVVLACRNEAKAAAATARIQAAVTATRIKAGGPAGTVASLSTLPLDLESLASVRQAAERLRAEHAQLDLLINNAGGLRVQHGQTEDGFERTLAVNHLGPFALTGLVLDRLLATPGSRVVAVSSIGHRRGEIHFDDLQFAGRYAYQHAYFQAKLANLLFTYELQRRLAAAGAATIAVAAHPGNARTEFGRDMNPLVRAAMSPHARLFTSWLLQSPRVGALAAVRAATDPGVQGGEYYGPTKGRQFTGYPARLESSPRSYDQETQARLWQESERLTGVTYPVGAAERAQPQQP